MKRRIASVLAIVMMLCMIAPQAALAAPTGTYRLTVSISGPNASGETKSISATSGTGTENTPLAFEVVTLTNNNKTAIEETFAGTGLSAVFNEGLSAYENDTNWEAYVNQYINDVTGDFKTILRNKNSTYADLDVNVDNVVRYTTVNGLTYTVTVTLKPYTSSSGGGGGVSTYAITVESAKNGSVTSNVKSAAKGATVTLTVEPDQGYTLETITATDASGNKLNLTEKDGKYTFTMPASKVTVKATFKGDSSTPNFFVDVPVDAYYYDAVRWAVENGITAGTDATHFSPNATCTRAQAVTFLWRAAGSPAPESTEMPFEDVAAGSYYETAVLWAIEQGITVGTSATTFSPNAKCTRAHIVSFLWRSQGSSAADSVNPFTDVEADAYYNSAVLWAVENGITAGTTATTFSPIANCTRAQIVTFLYRHMVK